MRLASDKNRCNRAPGAPDPQRAEPELTSADHPAAAGRSIKFAICGLNHARFWSRAVRPIEIKLMYDGPLVGRSQSGCR